MSFRITATAMAADWLLLLVLNQRWLSASLSDCGPDSSPECGMFDFFPQLIFGSGIVLAVIGLLVAVGVWVNRFAALVAGSLLHLVVLCQLGPSISEAPISDVAQTVWGWVFALANLVLACALFSFVAAPRMPKSSS